MATAATAKLGGGAAAATAATAPSDGICSAIGFHCTVDKMVGTEGEPRVVITFNGKFLPYVVQRVEDNVAQRGSGSV